MTLSLVRPVPLDSHPVVQLTYILPTPSIDSSYAGVKTCIRHRIPGGMIIGPSRFGKTYGWRYIRSILKEDYPKLFVIGCTAEKKIRPVESAFWENLLVSVGHKEPHKGTNSVKRERLVAKIVEMVVRSGLNYFILFIDEAPRLEVTEYEWLWDLHDRLESRNVRMMTFLVGTEKLITQKNAFREAGEIPIISRFMVDEIPFRGVRNATDAATCLQGYDEAVYPENSDWSYTRFFFPSAWSNGLRMSKAGDLLWGAFERAHNDAGFVFPLEIPMTYFSRAVEIIFGDFSSSDMDYFQLTDAIADKAVCDCKYVNAMTEICLGLGLDD